MNEPWLIYGAYGYTGRLITKLAVERGFRPIVAGRHRARTEALAAKFELPYRVFGLDLADDVDEGFAGVHAVLHVAGPFSRTYRAVAEACLRARCHYLDVTGEIGVFEGLHGLDSEAREAGIALLPGVGFDVVPTDCAGALVASHLENPVALDLAFHASGSLSRGTLRTALDRIADSSRVRRDGRIVEVGMGDLEREIPFADKPRTGVAIPWGDVSTAYYSTGVPDITVYQTGMTARVKQISRVRPLLKVGAVRGALQWWVGRTVDGPSEKELRERRMRVWAEARDADGRVAVAELTCPNGYALTADSAVESVRRLLDPHSGAKRIGFLTPSLAFGADFVDGLAGIEWVRRP
jgi:saccharopine dehydrogenase (NAD+, L-lysine-forming)